MKKTTDEGKKLADLYTRISKEVPKEVVETMVKSMCKELDRLKAMGGGTDEFVWDTKDMKDTYEKHTGRKVDDIWDERWRRDYLIDGGGDYDYDGTDDVKEWTKEEKDEAEHDWDIAFKDTSEPKEDELEASIKSLVDVVVALKGIIEETVDKYKGTTEDWNKNEAIMKAIREIRGDMVESELKCNNAKKKMEDHFKELEAAPKWNTLGGIAFTHKNVESSKDEYQVDIVNVYLQEVVKGKTKEFRTTIENEQLVCGSCGAGFVYHGDSPKGFLEEVKKSIEEHSGKYLITDVWVSKMSYPLAKKVYEMLWDAVGDHNNVTAELDESTVPNLTHYTIPDLARILNKVKELPTLIRIQREVTKSEIAGDITNREWLSEYEKRMAESMEELAKKEAK